MLKKFIISYTISFYTHRTPIRINYILLIRKSLIQQSKSSSIFCVPVAVIAIRNYSCKSTLQWESRPGPLIMVALLTGCVIQANYLPHLTFHFWVYFTVVFNPFYDPYASVSQPSLCLRLICEIGVL